MFSAALRRRRGKEPTIDPISLVAGVGGRSSEYGEGTSQKSTPVAAFNSSKAVSSLPSCSSLHAFACSVAQVDGSTLPIPLPETAPYPDGYTPKGTR